MLAQYAWALLTPVAARRDALGPGRWSFSNPAEDPADLGAGDVLLVMDFRRRVTLLLAHGGPRQPRWRQGRDP
ncbi:hypothetical protein ACTMU2_20715 [Cupriavidus basilensis]